MGAEVSPALASSEHRERVVNKKNELESFSTYCYKKCCIENTQKRSFFMQTAHEQKLVRLNIQIPKAMRDELAHASSRQGMKMSALVRESINEKINQLNKKWLEEDMKAAYEGLAEENTQAAQEFRFSDSENLD